MSEEKKNTFYKIYRYKNVEYRIDDNGIGLGLFVDGKYSDDAKNGYVPQGIRITEEREKKLIEFGGFEPVKESIIENKETETLKDNSDYKPDGKNGGARPGAGRPVGGENKKTKEKRIVKEEMKQRIMRSKDSLLNSQMNLAKGVQMLFKSKKLTIEDKEGNVIEIKKEKPILVESQSEIESYLAGEYDDDKDNYYFITIEYMNLHKDD